MLATWLRVIRLRFLLASAIAVFVGLALYWWQSYSVSLADAFLIFVGVLALHASVDLLNDFWDYKRGIDTKTKRTKMSGGTGVLPEGLLKPSSVYRAGIASLVIGSVVGCYFVVTHGIMIAAILGFAIVSIYFYSTRIVDSGLGELFVAIKGAMIVIGTYYIQSDQITVESALAGAVVGSLSSLVLFVTSFPDYDADKSGGRKTLVIVVGKSNAVKIFWVFPAVSYCCILAGVYVGLLPTLSLIALLGAPLLVKSWVALSRRYTARDANDHGSNCDNNHNHDACRDDTGDNADNNNEIRAMSYALTFSRATGVMFVAGLLLGTIPLG